MLRPLVIFCAECHTHVRGAADGLYIGTICDGCRERGRVDLARIEERGRDLLARVASQARGESGFSTPSPPRALTALVDPCYNERTEC